MTDDAIKKLYVTKNLVKWREMVENLVIYVYCRAMQYRHQLNSRLCIRLHVDCRATVYLFFSKKIAYEILLYQKLSLLCILFVGK